MLLFPFILGTDSGRFAVDREFEYIELVSWRGLGERFGPLGKVFGLPGELFGENFDQLLWNIMFQLLAKFGRDN